MERAPMFTNKWGALKQTHVPSSIFQHGVLSLGADALTVLIALLHGHKAQFLQMQDRDVERVATVKLSHKTLMLRTGYSINKITKALAALRNAGFIEPIPNYTVEQRRKGGKFGVTEYQLLRPGDPDRTPLTLRGQRNVLVANRIPYIALPSVVITETAERWSLAHMSASELKLYISVLSKAREIELSIPAAELRRISALSPVTFKKALDSLEDRGLLSVSALISGQKDLKITICDPYTGYALCKPDDNEQNDPANYVTTNAKGVTRRLILNTGSVEQIENLIRASIPEGQPVVKQGKGDLTIVCPYHPDHNPSLSVSPSKRFFHCFGCRKTGTLIDLIEKLTGGTKADAMKRMASATGQTAEFEPESNILAKYSYKDRFGNLKKQVLRLPNDNDGEKQFRQRQPVAGGWKYRVSGLPPLLYHADLLEMAETVVVCEGEKDADTITSLGLAGAYGIMTIGVTSGGADSWDASLAKQLRGKYVIILPDDDAPGAAYAEAVRASLEAEHIEYRMVSFQGSGAKDATEYVESHTVEDFVRLLGTDWVRMPDGTRLEDPCADIPQPCVFDSDDDLYEEITL